MSDFDPGPHRPGVDQRPRLGGVYEDKGLPALQHWLTRALRNPITWDTRVIPDDQAASAPP
jgi:molybdopterin biosynthesis enzyme MoaB